MKTYNVEVKEVHNAHYKILAKSTKHARQVVEQAIQAGEEPIDVVYDHTLKPDLWGVYKEKQTFI